MITETSNFKETHFIVSPGKKIDKNLIKKLIEKIEKKKCEPFAKIYVTFHPMFLNALMMALKDKKIEIKGMYSDKKVFSIEL
jgi:hypothetical protein